MNPTTFNLPKQTIDKIAKHCNGHGLKPAQFIEDTLTEYLNDIYKLVRAIALRLTSTNNQATEEIQRVAHRVSIKPCRRLRDLAKNSDMTFDGLTRTILADKLKSAAHINSCNGYK